MTWSCVNGCNSSSIHDFHSFSLAVNGACHSLTHFFPSFLLILSHSSSSFSLSPPPPLSPHSPPPLSIYPSYEIQLSEAVRRKGLGKFLIQLLELIGHKTAMKKVVLTVFKGVAAILDACSLW